jgi:hypothetical protein
LAFSALTRSEPIELVNNCFLIHLGHPFLLIDEAIKLSEGKKDLETIIVGVDPGKTFGIAVINDGT